MTRVIKISFWFHFTSLIMPEKFENGFNLHERRNFDKCFVLKDRDHKPESNVVHVKN